MIKKILQKIINRENLTFDESYQIMNSIMHGEVNNSQIAGLLVGLKSKGEIADEIGGFVKAMRENSLKIHSASNAIDVCGTGGDNSNTFNISTAVAFVVAGVGIKVAKHGNRSISSKSGSSDVLSELGINVNLTKEESEKALEKIGISFLFAPNYHPAMKYVMPVRTDLGIKTVFNILGPLTNPASTKRQLVGVFNNVTANLMREAASKLNMEKVCFICTEDSYDEITLSGTTKVFEFDKKNGYKDYEITPNTFGYSMIKIGELVGGESNENAKIILDIFNGRELGPKKNVIIANAALALYSSGYSEDLQKCKLAAEESLISGNALKKLNQLKELGENVS
jgi:anthranilate phosphoribosyltransferase